MRIKKISPTTPANGNIENQYGTSQTNAYSEEYINNAIPTKTSDLTNDSNFATTDVATTSANGLMSASDKTLLNNETTYSTTETRIGTWIDGKPIYRKVIRNSVAINGETRIQHNISNLDFCYNIRAFKKDISGTLTFFFPYLTNDGKPTHVIQVTRSEIIIRTQDTWGTSNETFIILEYTKTTD